MAAAITSPTRCPVCPTSDGCTSPPISQAAVITRPPCLLLHRASRSSRRGGRHPNRMKLASDSRSARRIEVSRRARPPSWTHGCERGRLRRRVTRPAASRVPRRAVLPRVGPGEPTPARRGGDWKAGRAGRAPRLRRGRGHRSRRFGIRGDRLAPRRVRGHHGRAGELDRFLVRPTHTAAVQRLPRDRTRRRTSATSSTTPRWGSRSSRDGSTGTPSGAARAVRARRTLSASCSSASS